LWRWSNSFFILQLDTQQTSDGQLSAEVAH